MVELKKGHNLVNISWNSLKNYSGHLNINSKPYAKYQNPSSKGSQGIVLTKFFSCYKLKKGHNFAILGLTEKNNNKIRIRLFFVLMLPVHIKF